MGLPFFYQKEQKLDLKLYITTYRFSFFNSDMFDTHVNIIIKSIDVEFFERVFSYKHRSISSKKGTHDESHDEPSISSIQ